MLNVCTRKVGDALRCCDDDVEWWRSILEEVECEGWGRPKMSEDFGLTMYSSKD